MGDITKGFKRVKPSKAVLRRAQKAVADYGRALSLEERELQRIVGKPGDCGCLEHQRFS